MIDPITLTVVQNGLGNICSEMDLVHEKASFSPVISEAFDRSNGLYDAATGAVIAQGDLGLPIFMGVMQATVAAVIARVRDPAPGDVFLVNDPYLGGTHLMDVKMVRPYFRDGRLWCWLANTGHWPDIGGMVPGGFSSRATEVHQEGLRIPPVRLVRAGELQQDIVDIVLSNIRVPAERVGDMQAQLGALGVGAARLDSFLDKLGEAVVQDAMAELADRSERQMRAHIAAIPDGTYEAVAVVDSDGIVDAPLHIRLRLTVDGGTASFDFAGSSPPCRGPMNSVWATTHSSVLLAMKHVFPDVPINTGCFRPLMVTRPAGTFLDAQYPLPVAGCAAEVSQRIAEAVFLCLAQAIPGQLFGMPAGTSGNLTLGGWDPRFGRAYVMYFFTGGGYGGWPGGGRHQQWHLHHRHLQDPAGGGAGTALPHPVRAVRFARRLLRRRRVARRHGTGLRLPAAGRQRHRILPDGPWPRRAARRGRGAGGGCQPDRIDARRQRFYATAIIQGRRLRIGARRPHRGSHAGWRRLWSAGAQVNSPARAR